MPKLFSALLGLALLSPSVILPALAQTHSVTQLASQASHQISHQVTLKTLADKLASLDSFQAEYSAISAETRAKLLLMVNRKRHYAMAQVSLDNDPQRWIVLDYSPETRVKGIVILMITEDGIQRIPMPFDAIMQDLNNPVGALRFLSQQLADVKLEPITGPGALTLHLGLTATDLNLSMAMNTRPGPTTGSWLQEADKALRSEVSGADLKLIYPEKREVLIDGASGLLKLESWPNPAKPGPREVKLLKHGDLTQDVPYQQLIPDFKQRQIQDAGFELITPQFYGGMLAELEPKQVPALTESSFKRVLQAARIRYRETLSQQPELVRAYRDEQLQPAYKNFISQNSGQRMSFEQFLAAVTAELEHAPGTVALPGVEAHLEKLESELRPALAMLPTDKAQKLAEIYGQGRLILVDAWSLEMLQAIAAL